MPKVKKQVDRELLQNTINDLESKQSFETLGNLFKAVSQEPWAIADDVKATIIGLRYYEYKLTSRTIPATKGKKEVTYESLHEECKKKLDKLQEDIDKVKIEHIRKLNELRRNCNHETITGIAIRTCKCCQLYGFSLRDDCLKKGINHDL